MISSSDILHAKVLIVDKEEVSVLLLERLLRGAGYVSITSTTDPGEVRASTRTGVDVPTRELLTFSMLVALGGCEPQVRGHVAANLRVGNDRARLIDVLTQLLPFIGYPRMLNALRAHRIVSTKIIEVLSREERS
jgi:hypothetical protein